MCKVLAITNMEKVKVTPEFIGIVKSEVCKMSDRDGFGYAVLGEDGSLGGEKTAKIKGFKGLVDRSVPSMVEKLPIVAKMNSAFGKMSLEMAKSFIAHGRFSTNIINIENTHPFYNGNLALIHNGVVQDGGKEKLKTLSTSCDTEILLKYWELGGMDAVEENVTGYYAMALLDRHKGLLHVVKDDKASLYISYCRTIDSYIIATTADIIKGLCKKMNWKYERPESILDNTYAVFDKNEIVEHRDIYPREDVSEWVKERAKKSLGTGYSGRGSTSYPYGGFNEEGIYMHDEYEDERPSYKEDMGGSKFGQRTKSHSRHPFSEQTLPNSDDPPDLSDDDDGFGEIEVLDMTNGGSRKVIKIG